MNRNIISTDRGSVEYYSDGGSSPRIVRYATLVIYPSLLTVFTGVTLIIIGVVSQPLYSIILYILKPSFTIKFILIPLLYVIAFTSIQIQYPNKNDKTLPQTIKIMNSLNILVILSIATYTMLSNLINIISSDNPLLTSCRAMETLNEDIINYIYYGYIAIASITPTISKTFLRKKIVNYSNTIVKILSKSLKATATILIILIILLYPATNYSYSTYLKTLKEKYNANNNSLEDI